MEKKVKLLLAEDDENLGLLLKEYLIAKGYETDLYPDGEAAYKGFTKNQPYSLCILDIMMPKKRWNFAGQRYSLIKYGCPDYFPNSQKHEGRCIGRFLKLVPTTISQNLLAWKS